MNHRAGKSRPEATNGLGELLERCVPKLSDLTMQFGDATTPLRLQSHKLVSFELGLGTALDCRLESQHVAVRGVGYVFRALHFPCATVPVSLPE